MSRDRNGEPGARVAKLCSKCGQVPRDGRQRWCRGCRTQHERDRRTLLRRSTAVTVEQETAQGVSITIQSPTYPLRILAGFATILECERGEPLTVQSCVPTTMKALQDLARQYPAWACEVRS